MRTAELRKAHHATTTNAVYSTGFQAYLRFTLFFGLVVLPPSDEALAAFIAFQSVTCCYGTLKVYLYGIRDWTLQKGYPFTPWHQRYPVFSAMCGVKRLFGGAQEKKLAVSPELLVSMISLLDLSQFNDVMVRAAMLVAFFGMFRKDNISVAKASAFNPRANLTKGDFMIKGSRIWVRVGHSKVNQYGTRFHWVPLEPIPGSKLCPVTAVFAALALTPNASDDFPMFLWRSIPCAAAKPMTHTNFVGIEI